VADKLTEILKKQLKNRDKNIKLIESEVLRVLEKASSQIYNDINFSDLLEENANAYAVVANLPDALRGAGLEDIFNTIQDGYADDLEFIEETLGQLSLPPLADIDRQSIAVIIESDLNLIRNRFQTYTGDLAQALTRNILTGQAPDFSVLTESLNSRTANYVITEFDTALSGLDSAINIKKAKELFENPKFIYLGADDKLTRSFCRSLIGKILTLKEIEALETSGGNGQGLPVMEYRGGYNCRHQWRVIRDEDKT
jgi:hypothetical protein